MPASRSLIALLVGTVVFFALWMVALKPSSSNKSPSSSQGLGSFQSAINKAHQAVATSNKNEAASGNENAASGSSGATTAATTTKPKTSTKTSASSGAAHQTKATRSKHSTARVAVTPKQTLAANITTVKAAVTDHKVVALLFYNPAAADDAAVKQELSSVPTHKGQVIKLAIPVNESANFTAVTQQVPLNLTPTLVLVSRTGDASEIIGYSSPFEIDQRVADALSVG